MRDKYCLKKGMNQEKFLQVCLYSKCLISSLLVVVCLIRHSITRQKHCPTASLYILFLYYDYLQHVLLWSILIWNFLLNPNKELFIRFAQIRLFTSFAACIRFLPLLEHQKDIIGVRCDVKWVCHRICEILFLAKGFILCLTEFRRCQDVYCESYED